MRLDELAPNVIIRGALFPEPVQVLVVVPMGDAFKIIAKGLESGKVHEPILTPAQLAARAGGLAPTQGETPLRERLVQIALEWESAFGVAPSITTQVSEYDAAMLIGHTPESYSRDCAGKTAVAKGSDFTFNGLRYQVKANRPSGKPGSFVTLVSKAKNYDWDHLIWILYDREYQLLEAWRWDVEAYRRRFHEEIRLSPRHMREGRKLR